MITIPENWTLFNMRDGEDLVRPVRPELWYILGEDGAVSAGFDTKDAALAEITEAGYEPSTDVKDIGGCYVVAQGKEFVPFLLGAYEEDEDAPELGEFVKEDV